ncbi:MAG: hypothetical protein LUH19_01650 [Lachnospiraceae bacterium]|nr:hypothetical protein [Lachnospiraceae bacterium]
MRKNMKKLTALLLGAAMALSTAGCSFSGSANSTETAAATGTGSSSSETAAPYILLSEASYPEMATYPNEEDYYTADGDWDYEAWNADYAAWQESYDTLKDAGEGYDASLLSFFDTSTAEILSGAGEENRIYSPINVWLALAMLAETTDGDTRQEILTLCGADDIEALRAQASDVWQMAYSNDGNVTTILGSSLWLSNSLDYHQEVLDTLANSYYASSYYGKMGSDDFSQALRDWLNEQTCGLLSEQAEGMELSAETILALATTIYYKAAWVDEFSEDNTYQQTFHALSGDIDCDFMHQSDTGAVYYGDGFMATGLSLQRGGTMWLILPDEDATVDAVLNGTNLTEFISTKSKAEWDNREYYQINLSLPKFDVCSSLSLVDALSSLGVTSVFDSTAADFSPLTDTANVYVSSVEHAARVKIDEEGVEAAAYTVITMQSTAAESPELIDFTLDRPFLFAITDTNGLPLFVGVVNEP